MDIAFTDRQAPRSGALIVASLADRQLTAGAEEIDRLTGGQVTRAMTASPRFTGKREEILAIPGPAGIAADRVILVGLGPADGLTALNCQKLGGVIAAHLNATAVVEAVLWADMPKDAPIDTAAAAAEIAYGAGLRAYRFDRYRTTQRAESKPTLETLTVELADPAAAQAAFERREPVAAAVAIARDLVSEPANVLYPARFAERCESLRALGLEVEVLDEAALERIGMGALLAVGHGSERESRVVVLTWRGAGDDSAPLALIGKGVTFDTGGISLKPPAGMEDMKWDMAGAGAVTGAMAALAGRKARVNAVGVLGLVENMPSGRAQRPGDVVTSLSGQTVEVINTDAEGRLVLCDLLTYVQDRFSPRAMVDFATLTGAVIIALGTHNAGLFASDDALAEQIAEAGRHTGETVWRLPMGEAYDRDIDSDIADMRNVAGNRNAGSVIGAQFLKRFVREVPWAHVDIAGVAWARKDGALGPKGATAFGVRLCDRLAEAFFESR